MDCCKIVKEIPSNWISQEAQKSLGNVNIYECFSYIIYPCILSKNGRNHSIIRSCLIGEIILVSSNDIFFQNFSFLACNNSVQNLSLSNKNLIIEFGIAGESSVTSLKDAVDEVHTTHIQKGHLDIKR